MKVNITSTISSFDNSKELNYAFVTFEHAKDAFNVYDKRMFEPAFTTMDISFGGRRSFCKTGYQDLGEC